jgi:ABC-type nickel/cobalt efflux system permease component RcnA
MKSCSGCLMVLFVLFVIGLVIQVVTATWPILLGLFLSWASMRYIYRDKGDE